MEKMIRLGLATGLLAVALVFGGCVWFGLDIGKSPTPTMAQIEQTAEAETNDLSK